MNQYQAERQHLLNQLDAVHTLIKSLPERLKQTTTIEQAHHLSNFLQHLTNYITELETKMQQVNAQEYAAHVVAVLNQEPLQTPRTIH